jgi:hypothetical protein
MSSARFVKTDIRLGFTDDVLNQARAKLIGGLIPSEGKLGVGSSDTKTCDFVQTNTGVAKDCSVQKIHRSVELKQCPTVPVSQLAIARKQRMSALMTGQSLENETTCALVENAKTALRKASALNRASTLRGPRSNGSKSAPTSTARAGGKIRLKPRQSRGHSSSQITLSSNQWQQQQQGSRSKWQG